MNWLRKAAEWVNPVVGLNKYLWDQMHKKAPTPAARVPQFSSFGQPLPIVWGKTRITGNVIYFKKDALSDGRNAIVIALAEGPVTGISRVWKDQSSEAVNWVDGAITGRRLMSQGIFRAGQRPTQTGCTIIQSVDPTAYMVTYPGIAYVAYMNQTAPETMIGYSFEVKGLRYGSGNATEGDAHPADVVQDFLANAYFGCGVDAERVVTEVGQDGSPNSSLRRYATAEGFFISPAVTEQREAREHLREILDSVNAEVVWSEGKFKILPYGDTAVTGNGVTYSPVVNPQYDLTNEDFLDSDDPVQADLEPDTDKWNIWPVEFLERKTATELSGMSDADRTAALEKGYNVAVVESPDTEDEARFGAKRAPTAALHAICLRSVAQKISQIRSQKAARSRAEYTFRLGWRFCRLEPMDLVTLTDTNLGISKRPVRITSIEEDYNFNLTVRAEEWPFGIAGTTEHNTASGEGFVTWTDSELDATEPAARDGSNVPDNSWPGTIIEDGTVTVAKLEVDILKTSNYSEEDGTKGSGFPVGTPLAGAKLDYQGTALKVAANNLQIGPRVLADFGQAYASGRVFLPGGYDPVVQFSHNVASVTRGVTTPSAVAPPADCLLVTLSTPVPSDIIVLISRCGGGTSFPLTHSVWLSNRWVSGQTVDAFYVGVHNASGAWLSTMSSSANFQFIILAAV